MKPAGIAITISLLLPFSAIRAQFTDSLEVRTGTRATIATKDYQPLWLTANKFGTMTDRKSDLSTYIRAKNVHTFGQEQNWRLQYGISVYNNNHFRRNFFEEAYVKFSFKKLELRAGRYEEIIGDVDPELSSGSLGVSGNALPIPKVSIGLKEYAPVPFTNGWVQVKGQFSHGWMGRNQFIPYAFLHEKNFYLRIGKRKLKAYGGIQHYAVWGGNRKDLPKIKSSFKDYLDVVLVKEADDGTVISDEIRPNRPGDHRGVLEGGLEWENENVAFRAYNQTPFETGQGIDIRNTDHLMGLSFRDKRENAVLLKATLELISTKKMNNWHPKQVRESYYNNGVYLTGWEYENRIIGTPLFTNRSRGQYYFDNIQPFDYSERWNVIRSKGWNIINNRVSGVHLGALYRLGQMLEGKTMFTYTRNFGTYEPGPFKEALSQWYAMQQVRYVTPVQGLTLTGAVGLDGGDMSQTAGFMLGVEWLFAPGRR